MDFKKEAVKVLKKALPREKDFAIEIPKDAKLGDIAFPCFTLAEKEKRNPSVIAKEVVKKIKLKGTIFTGVTSFGPYINFFLDKDRASQEIIKELNKKELIKKSKPERVMVEFFQPNTHKGIHIGHTRNVIIGESISRILEEKGIRVVRTTYGGDIGPHVAKCLWGYMNLNLKPEGDKGEWLGRVYAIANEKINTEQKKKEVNSVNNRLYAGDKSLVTVWKLTRNWSINHMNKVLKLVNTKMNSFLWESQVEKSGLKIAKQLLKKGVLKESEGAIIADLTKHGLEVVVIVAKDGTPLYLAKDLGLAELEFKKHKVSKVIHVVAVEQLLYFKQLFKIFELAGWKWAENSVHRVYELVGLKEGRMSSRTGNLILFTELYEKMFNLALTEVQKRNPKLKLKKQEELSHQIAMSAMKYGMLSRDLNRKILFDYKDWLSFEGNTGPYIQYSYVRAKKILKKLGKARAQMIKIENDYEYGLVNQLNKFPAVYASAYKKLNPPVIARYAYELATAFSKFYEHCPVIKSEYSGSRAKIIKTYLIVMGKVIHLLGLKPMNMM